MTRTLLIAAAALTLAACASAPEPMGAPTSEVRAPVGEASQANWDAGNAGYLAWNAGRPGWTTTESGLQYRRISPANPEGRQPVAADTVRVHYRGTFIDGREFDGSWARGEPTEFPLNRVIRGWTEGMQLMVEGERTRFWIPQDLAYKGEAGSPRGMLVFDVELIRIE